jgi:integrase
LLPHRTGRLQIAKRPDKLVLHGRKWVLRQPVPRSVRHLFLSSNGKPMAKIVMPLDGDYAIAKVMAADRVARCVDVFARCKAGIITTPEQAKAALHEEWSEPDIALQPGYDEAMRQWYADHPVDKWRDRLFQQLGVPAAVRPAADAMLRDWRAKGWPLSAEEEEQIAKRFEEHGNSGEQPATRPAPTAGGETISQAAEAWLAEMTRDKNAAPRQQTVDGHRLRVRAFVDKCGDLPLAGITGAIAYDFLAGLKVSNRTRNNYATTLKCVFKCARDKRHTFTGDNPFAGKRSKVAKNHKVRFTLDELQTLFDKLPPRELAPKKHTPLTAVPWVALISAYSGACLEEICQLNVDDVREEGVNGGRLWCIDIHNGDDEHKVKNEARPRLLPIHSALERAGLLEYIANLPNKRGQLFPGLQRRASKDKKFGPRVGEIFNKKLRAFGIKTSKGKDFHSFRHTVSNVLEIAGVSQTDAARVLGHSIEGMSYGTYSQPGPGLIRVKDLVEKIKYEGLTVGAPL